MTSRWLGIMVGAVLGWSAVLLAQTPTLTITLPTVAATVSGTAVPFAARASGAGITSLQWFVDKVPFGAPITAGACTAAWDSTTVADGTHQVMARGTTATGTVDSGTVGVIVANSAQQDTTPPTVTITTPATIPLAPIDLAATATDNVGVAGVRFTVDGKQIADDTVAPFVAAWSPSAAGVYTVVAEARDAAGNRGMATKAITVTVQVQPPPEAVFCANENGLCSYSGATRAVWYGAGGLWTSTSTPWQSPVACTHLGTNPPFGSDPSPGVVKECRVVPDSAPPVDCQGTWSSPTVTYGACVNGSRSKTSTRVFTVTTPPSNGGAACPASPEVTVTTEACNAPPLPTVSMNVLTCTLDVRATVGPDGTSTGWRVQYTRNGVSHGSADTSTPYQRSATVTAGSYAMAATWTRTGQATVTQDLGTKSCQ